MNKKMKSLAVLLVVVGLAAAVYFLLLKPEPTSMQVKNPVDVQYEQLCIELNNLEAEVVRDSANVDSLADVLKALRWKTVKDGKEYERQKRNLYLDQKKNVALKFYEVMMKQTGNQEVDSFFINIESISE